MFLGLPDPDPNPLVRGMDPDPALDPDTFPINLQTIMFAMSGGHRFGLSLASGE